MLQLHILLLLRIYNILYRFKKYFLTIYKQMLDDWENWENEDLIIQSLTLNKERLKKLEERKLVEESDNKLTNDLFSNEEDLINEDINYDKKPTAPNENKEKKKKKNVNNYNLNQEKQKNLSKIIKHQKAIKQREKDLFGEAEYDEYDKYIEYEEQFY